MMAVDKLVIVLMSIALAACGGEGGSGNGHDAVEGAEALPAPATAERRTVAETLALSPDHIELVRLLEAAGIAGTFRRDRPYTVLAPTDAAFAASPDELGTNLGTPEARERLVARLSYHVVPGTVTVAEMEAAMARGAGGRAELATVTGARLGLRREGGTIVIEDAAGAHSRIVSPGEPLANGIVHGIDAVLTPSG